MVSDVITCDDGCGQISRACLARNLVTATDIGRRKEAGPSTVNGWMERYQDWPPHIVLPGDNGLGGRWWWPDVEAFLDRHHLPRWDREGGAVSAEDLPPRVAHAVHALMARWADMDGSAPVTAAEVCEYDSEALTVASTAGALSHARRFGLTDGHDGLWFATNRAWKMRQELEDRFLNEVPE